MKRSNVIAFLTLFVFGLAAQTVPPLVNYQGRLSNPDGSLLATGNYQLTFKVYDASANGNLVWGPEFYDGTTGQGHGAMIPVVQGYFNVLLGPSDINGVSLASAFSGTNRFVEVTISNFPPIAPRQQILTTPYAFQAAQAANATLSSNVISGISITNASITNSAYAGNGAGLTNLNASQLTSGTIPLPQLPASVVLTDGTGVNLNGTFSGNGTGLTSLNASQLAGGLVPIGVIPGNLQTLNTNDAINLTNIQAAALPLALQLLNTNNGAALTNLSASQLVSGSVSSGLLPANLQALNTNNAVNLLNIQPTALPLALQLLNTNNGAALNNLNASQLVSGSVSSALLPANLQALNTNNGTNLINIQPAALPLALRPLNTNNGANLINLTAGNIVAPPWQTGAAFLTNWALFNTNFAGMSGSNLSHLDATNIEGALPAISGAKLTSLPAGNLTGALPAVSGANLTSLPANAALLNANQTFAGKNNFTNTTGIGSTNNYVGIVASRVLTIGGDPTPTNFPGTAALVLENNSLNPANSNYWYLSTYTDGTLNFVATGGGNHTLTAPNLIVSGNITYGTLTHANNALEIKEKFKPVNPLAVLEKVARLPITEWQFKSEADARHVGPMTEDFHAAFALGPDEKHIATSDEDGVALAAIQGLNQKLETVEKSAREKDARIQALTRRLDELETAMRALADKK